MSTPAALEGIVVIDLTDVNGGMAGRVLADLGADVIHIEPPGGSDLRRVPPFRVGKERDPCGSLTWAAFTLGKRSIVLDRTNDSDRRRLQALIDGADVLIEADP